MNLTGIMFVMSVSVSAIKCSAQEINLSDSLSSAIFSNRPGHAIYVPDLKFTCHPDGTVSGLPGTIPGALGPYLKCVIGYSHIHVIPVNVLYSDVKYSPLPDAVSAKPFLYTNCDNTPLPITDEIVLETTEGTSVKKSTVVTAGSNLTLDGKIDLPIKVLTFGMSASENIKFERTDETEESNTQQKASKVTQKILITIAPRSVHETKLIKTMRAGYVDFDGTVEVSGFADLQLQFRKDSTLFGNPIPLGPLSATLPKRARILHLKGQMWNVQSEAVNRVDIESPLSADSKVCNLTPNPN